MRTSQQASQLGLYYLLFHLYEMLESFQPTFLSNVGLSCRYHFLMAGSSVVTITQWGVVWKMVCYALFTTYHMLIISKQLSLIFWWSSKNSLLWLIEQRYSPALYVQDWWNANTYWIKSQTGSRNIWIKWCALNTHGSIIGVL